MHEKVKKSKILTWMKTKACNLIHNYPRFFVGFIKLCRTMGGSGSWNTRLGTCFLHYFVFLIMTFRSYQLFLSLNSCLRVPMYPLICTKKNCSFYSLLWFHLISSRCYLKHGCRRLVCLKVTSLNCCGKLGCLCP